MILIFSATISAVFLILHAYLSFEGILDTAKETNQKLIGQRKTIILGEIANCAGTQNVVEDVQIQLLEWRLIIHIIHS